MEKLEICTVIKYFCKKGMPPKEIHEDLKNVGKEYPSYNTVNKWASDPEFKRGRGSTEEHQRCHH